jgi:P-type Cu+ transporter
VHPYATRIDESLSPEGLAQRVRSFRETPGCGLEGVVAGQELWMGSAEWIESRGIPIGHRTRTDHSSVHLVIDGRIRGAFIFENAPRPNTDSLIRSLSQNYDLALLSGDNERERDHFQNVFGSFASLNFKQSPLSKLQFIRNLQDSGKNVMMVGDGLNDAGALKQSNVGVAVVENIAAFSPASDIIMSARMVPQLDGVLRYSRGAVRIVHLGFLISTIYNVAGIAIAASGRLSPIVCAILMPLSSISVVACACAATTWFARKVRLGSAERKTQL